mmetsp:Transcript_78557/g.156175  ORF Transcript_78557/g.156175 Transcript_78557/m.156175 type:complete len:510 (-) Transcript_78557:336-1865(-)
MHVFLLLALLSSTSARSSLHPDEVTLLPGYLGPLRSKLYSGYLKAEANNQTFFTHYVLTESRRNPANDPLVLWQQGGPGSSGFGFGFLAELGPYVLDADSLTSNRSRTPRPFSRQYSWDATANLLLFEHPPGTGFSYCVNAAGTPVACEWNDQTQAQAFYNTLLAFYARWPQYEAKDLHMIGESYAGLLLPFLAAEIYQHPDETPAKRLKGLAVGNGCPGTSGATPDRRGSCNGPYGSYDTQHVIELAAGHSALPRDLYTDLKRECGFPCVAPTWSEDCMTFSAACNKLLGEADAAIGPFNIYNFYDNCGAGNAQQAGTGVPTNGAERHDQLTGVATLLQHARRYGNPSSGGEEYPCGTGKAATIWANTPEVREALHMHSESFYGRPWSLQAGAGMRYATYTGASYDLYPSLLAQVDVLIYNGDVDACVPYNSNADWVEALAKQQSYAQTQPWRPWLLNTVPAGYVTRYTAGRHNLTFLTVKESGHMVPQYQPERAFAFFSKWLNGEAF